MSLLVTQQLAAMLQAAEELVAVIQVVAHGVVQNAVPIQCSDRLQRPANAQVGLAEAVQKLKNLHEEFDVANAAAAALQIALMGQRLDSPAHRKHLLEGRFAQLRLEASPFSQGVQAR